MHRHLARAALAAALLNTSPANAADEAAIVVTATRFATPDIEATYASEVHTRKQIDQSGASTLYDYLAQHTSLQLAPSYGNRFTPKIDMRGYGIGDGYQNIVISIDGQRMNNIDMSGQLIGAIPLADIDRIEITKGSGSVIFGDGATAGSIQIYTRPKGGFSVEAHAGNFGTAGASLKAGHVSDSLTLSATFDNYDTDGASRRDISGHKASSERDTGRISLAVKPVDALTLKLDASSTRIETRYAGRLTLAQLNADPSQNGGNTYTLQELSTDSWRAGAEFKLTRDLKFSASRNREDKLSRYVISGYIADYDYLSDDVALSYEGERLGLIGGYQRFDGTLKKSTDRTSKDNASWFAQGYGYFDETTLSIGARTERVSYAYRPNAGASLGRSEDLHAWDVGLNHRLTERVTVFGNLNNAYQAPDINRFFRNGAFNAFIEPAKVRTLNLGINHVTSTNRLKAAVFRSNLKNEIYYYSTGNFLTSYNTNIDKSHKHGLELQDVWQATRSLSLSANYSWIRATIDRERDGGGAYNGKDLPGVSRHNVNLGLNYRFNDRASINVGHVWRSRAWAAEDFDNNNLQKQRAYSMTNVAFRYRIKDSEFFAAVDNLFERTNGLWIRDDRVYPIDFSRTWRVGFRAGF